MRLDIMPTGELWLVERGPQLVHRYAVHLADSTSSTRGSTSLSRNVPLTRILRGMFMADPSMFIEPGGKQCIPTSKALSMNEREDFRRRTRTAWRNPPFFETLAVKSFEPQSSEGTQSKRHRTRPILSIGQYPNTALP